MSDSQVSISSLEITKNPFESDIIEGKLNYPGFSPSMFVHQKTPVNERKKKEFCWSIEHISRLYPADVDEYPQQEYSSTYERPEDEKAAQEAIEEYFSQDAIVPSPWTPNRSAKKVTFSPLPPDTQYIPGNDCSFDSTFSQNSSMNVKKSDACTQTLWSIPLNAVHLDEILGKAFENCLHNTSDDSKNLSNSSLRRNLFPIDEQMHGKTDQNNNQPRHVIRSILKTSKSPVLATSSPLSSKTSHMRESSKSPGTPYLDVSPIKISPLNKLREMKSLDSPSSRSLLSTSNVLESSGMGKDLEMFLDISPIKDNGENDDDDDEEISNKNMSTGNKDRTNESSMTQDSASQANETNTYDDDDDDDDDDKPAKITMEDLTEADDDDDDDTGRHDDDGDDDENEKPAMLTMEDLASDDGSNDNDNSISDNDDIHSSITMEDLSAPNDNDTTPPNLTAEDLSIPAHKETHMLGQAANNAPEAMETSMIGNPPSFAQERMVLSELSFVNKQSHHTREQYGALDEDLVIIKAAAAIRRANRFNKDNNYRSDVPSKSDFSLTNMNISELPWQPVTMSTPVNAQARERIYGSSFDNDHDGRDYLGRTREAEAMRSYGEHGYQDGSKRLSPVMEDVIRRQGVLKATLREVNMNSWMQPTTPLYPTPGKWRTPRSYPLSNVERKTLYGKPQRIAGYVDYYSPQLYNNDVLKYESKRTSWPPTRHIPSRLSTRPLSPTSWPNKVYSTYPEGSVSRMPIPCAGSTIDSGFDDWKKTISRHEKSMKIQEIKLMPFY